MSPEHHDYLVQPVALAEVIHDDIACPFSHSPKSQKYMPKEECPRLAHLVRWATEMLEAASQKEFRPATVKVGGAEWVQDTLL